MTLSPAGLRVRGALFLSASEQQQTWPKSPPANSSVRSAPRPAKVHWPTRKETVATAIMVIIMTLMLAFFFFGVDAFFSTLVKYLLSLLG